MFTCKQVSNALAKEDYNNLPPLKRFFLKLHVKLCIFCGKFNRQVVESQDMCRCYKEHDEHLASTRETMDVDRKDALKRSLASAAAPSRNLVAEDSLDPIER